MSTTIKIFVTGATGYLGGSVLTRLLKHRNAPSFEITALVRSAEKADKLKTLGVNVVLGSYNEKLDLLTEAASQADVVFAIADSDNLPAAQAILDGLKAKYEKTGKAPVLIHTSGSAFISDDARGLHAEHATYSDLDVEKLNVIPVSALHRNVDIPIIEADKAGYVKSFIITPGTIFGYPSGPLVDLGIQNIHSVQMPYFIRPSIARKQGGYFGKGLNQWSAVDVNETADLYLILFDAILSNAPGLGHGVEGYYFVENFEYSAIEVAETISEALVELGIATKKETSAFTQEEADKNFGAFWTILATNCYAKGDRSRALGWTPVRGKKDFLKNVKQEVKALLPKPE